LALEEHLERRWNEPTKLGRRSHAMKSLFTLHRGPRRFSLRGDRVRFRRKTASDFRPESFRRKAPDVAAKYQRGELVYSKRLRASATRRARRRCVGRRRSARDRFVLSMMKVRAEKVRSRSRFQKFRDLREDTIENADEIWRRTISKGIFSSASFANIPSTKRRSCPTSSSPRRRHSNVHCAFVLFPTNDKTLVDRYPARGESPGRRSRPGKFTLTALLPLGRNRIESNRP